MFAIDRSLVFAAYARCTGLWMSCDRVTRPHAVSRDHHNNHQQQQQLYHSHHRKTYVSDEVLQIELSGTSIGNAWGGGTNSPLPKSYKRSGGTADKIAQGRYHKLQNASTTRREIKISNLSGHAIER